MRARPTLATALAAGLVALAHAPMAHAVGPCPQVEVASARMHAGDLVQGLSPAAASVDLGPTPPAAGSRLVSRDEFIRAFTEAGLAVPTRLPAAVRAIRRMRTLPSDTVETLVRDALAAHMPRGTTLAAVRAARSLAVPDGYTTVRAELPRMPRRTGAMHTDAALTFLQGDEVLTRVTVPVELSLGPAAAIPDAARGAVVRLVVRRGLVEVTVGAEAAADADVGDVLPVLIHPSGRVLRARLIEPDRALVLEAP